MDDQLITFTLTILFRRSKLSIRGKERKMTFCLSEPRVTFLTLGRTCITHLYLRDKCEGFPSSLPGTFAVASLHFSYTLSSLLLPSLNVHWSVPKMLLLFSFIFFNFFFLDRIMLWN